MYIDLIRSMTLIYLGNKCLMERYNTSMYFLSASILNGSKAIIEDADGSFQANYLVCDFSIKM